MQEISFALSATGIGDEASMPVKPTTQDIDDASQFREWLQMQGAGSTIEPRGFGAGVPVSGSLLAAGEALHQREADYFRTLERAARTGDPIEGLAVQRRLSELYLDHGLAVKVIAKTTQALESLTKLQ
jgi:urease accessory protein UreH